MTRLKPLVLAVEDDPDFLKTLEVVLPRFGLNVVCTATGSDFLEKAQQLLPDLYLIDLQLGNNSGFDLITELREVRKIAQPILVISGEKGVDKIAHALELGANDFISKPLDRVFLASKLSLYLSSEAIEGHRASFSNLPNGRAPVRLVLNARVTEMDELGLKLETKSLVPKGTVLKLRAEVLREAGIPDGEALVAIVSSVLNPEAQLYTIYAEFDGVDTDFMQSIRRWLAT